MGNVDVLIIFQGPTEYIPLSWYPRKTETEKVGPTGNDAIVHAYGTLQVIDDRAWLREFIEKLTNRHEAECGDPWDVTDVPSDFIEKQPILRQG